MLHTKFQASKPSGSEEEDFLIFFYAFLWFEPTTPDQRPSWTRQCYVPNFKHLGQVVLKKKIFEYISMHFYGLNLGPPGAGPSWTLGPWFEQTW